MGSPSRTKLQIIQEASIEDIQSAFDSNELTSTEMVKYYLGEIEKQKDDLCALIEVNPDAIDLAEKADVDRRRAQSQPRSMLHGIPVLLKDNITTKDKCKTTAGAFVLMDSIAAQDAGVVEKLRRAGAIILGKAGLTEWSSARTGYCPDGWSARGGIVKNPYFKEDSKSGSSTGSAVSVAANLAMVSLGTETIGSILWPCNENCVVGIKPTVGITSRSGVIPYSNRQDSVGPIGRTVTDVVHLLDTIAGIDLRDLATQEAAKYIPVGGYTQYLKADGLRGKRIGNLWKHYQYTYENQQDSPVPEIFKQHIGTMRDRGAEIIELDVPNFDTISNNNFSSMAEALSYELKRDLNNYLSDLEVSLIRTLSDVIEYNENNPEQEKMEEYGQENFTDAEGQDLPDDDYDQAINSLENCKEFLMDLMMSHQLDAVVAPEGYFSGLLSAAECPGIIVPAGFDLDTPFGIMFGGLKGYEPRLVEIAYSFEQATKIRKSPV